MCRNLIAVTLMLIITALVVPAAMHAQSADIQPVYRSFPAAAPVKPASMKLNPVNLGVSAAAKNSNQSEQQPASVILGATPATSVVTPKATTVQLGQVQMPKNGSAPRLTIFYPNPY